MKNFTFSLTLFVFEIEFFFYKFTNLYVGILFVCDIFFSLKKESKFYVEISRFKCYRGFTLVGPIDASCTQNGWSPSETPVCVSTGCLQHTQVLYCTVQSRRVYTDNPVYCFHSIPTTYTGFVLYSTGQYFCKMYTQNPSVFPHGSK